MSLRMSLEEHAIWIKTGIAAVLGFFTALWGWMGWLVFLWVILMALDYISGSLAAKKKGEWKSSVARERLAGKGGMILFVLGATALDILIGLAVNNFPGIIGPLNYKVPIVCLVLCWYIITEIGSIFENAGKLGGGWPPFMKKIIETMKAKFGGKEE